MTASKLCFQPSRLPPETIHFSECELLWWPQWLSSTDSRSLFEQLYKKANWRQEQITLYGKEHPVPRLQAWYGDAGAAYGYSGIALEPEPWLPELESLRQAVQQASGEMFNSVLVNLYRDGQDSNGWHADNEPELGERPVIASVSLGETRRFRFRAQLDKQQTHALDLPDGSLLVMGAGTQQHWQHQITKTRRAVGPRINLTFRRVVSVKELSV